MMTKSAMGRYRLMSCAWYSYSVDEPGQLQDGRGKDGIRFVWSCDVFPAFAEAKNGRNLSNVPIIRSLYWVFFALARPVRTSHTLNIEETGYCSVLRFICRQSLPLSLNCSMGFH